MPIDKKEDNKLNISDSNWNDQHQNILDMAGYTGQTEIYNSLFDSNETFAPWERVQVGDYISNSTKK
ncbi:MAG: hypothetical protein JKY84_06130 [Emcibacteraceae bacterium]|nr:hypothetical protein [Emcibacteraceae bacterium]